MKDTQKPDQNQRTGQLFNYKWNYRGRGSGMKPVMTKT
jgi:hypothetical protein